MKKLAYSFAVVLLLTLPLCAQTITGRDADKMIPGAEMITTSAKSSIPAYVRFHEGKEISSSSVTTWMKTAFGLGERGGLQLLNVQNDKLGMMHYRYQQTVNNIPVEGAVYIVHTKGGKVTSMNGLLFDHLNVPSRPAISEATALNKALAYMNASSYRWQSAAQEKELKRITKNKNATWFPKGLLTIVSLQDEGVAGSYRLAYRFDIYADKPLKREYVFVDAQTGKIIYTENRIENANANGTAVTAYSGIQPITTDSTAVNNFILNETGRGDGIETLNLKTGTDYGAAVNFTDADDYWNNVNAAQDQYATDAHWGAEKTYDFYLQKFGRNSIDGNGFQLISYVHYDVGYLNAFWDGQEMNYGDGSTGYTPLTSPEIAGHEISHGLTQFTSALVEMDESGALNEGFSDCMGASIRHFGEQSAVIDWGIGDEIGGTPFRNMADPKLYGNPDTYKGINWDSTTQEVHQNSTILSHAYYLLTEGGNGTNDNGDAYSVTGIGIEEAEAIWFRMNTVYLFPNVVYADARTYSIQSAIDLFGACTNEVIQVTNAWHAVGVGSVFTATVSGTFASNITSSCGVPVNIDFNNTTSNASSFLWNFGDDDTSTTANPVHTYSSYGMFTVTLIASGGACGTDTIVKNAYINLSNESPSIGGVDAICKGASATLTATGMDSIKWYSVASGGAPVGSGATFNSPPLNAAATYYAESDIYPAPVNVGPVDNTIGSGGYFTNNTVERGLIFSCFSPVTLISVVVYAQAAGNRTIDLRDSSGNVLQTKTVNLPTGKSAVTLNFNIPVATNMQLGCSGDPNLFRNTAGANYPFNITNVISITGNNAEATGYYYFFYNWLLRGEPCITERTPVTVTLDSAAFTYIASAYTFNFTDASTNATSWFWSFGDGDTSTQQNPVHIYGTTGNYNVMLIAENNGCSDTAFQTINIIETGIGEYSKNAFALYPNPAENWFTISALQSANMITLNIFNMLGEKIMDQQLILNEHPVINVKNLPAGIYFLTIVDGNGTWTGKFIKE